MMHISELRNKDVIEISDGRRIGFINDIEINTEQGCVEAIIIPAGRKILPWFSKDSETVLYWRQINKIGIDVILTAQDGVAEGKAENKNGQPAKASYPLDDTDIYDFF